MPNRIDRGRCRTRKTQRATRPAVIAALQRAAPPPPTDTQQLARAVPHLSPETLHQIVRHYGLDACLEIVASATAAQLTSIFDADLWRSAQPGRDERFDTERFGEWLEVLADAGGSAAARIVAAMDEHLVITGLSRYVRVFDPAALATTVDGEPLDIDVPSHQGPECEVGGYLVRGISSDAWDAIIALLVALDTDHHDRFHAVMRECRRLSNSTPEVDGLDDLLMDPEQLLHDVALDREQRRSEKGYSTPADARAFLLMARRRRPSNGEPAPQPPRALLEAADSQHSRSRRIRALLEYLRHSDDTLYLARSHELAFLANTLVAGCSIQSRSLTPREASDAAIGICNLGLEHWPARWREPVASSRAGLDAALPDAFLMDHDLVSAFEVGWTVLYEDVSLFVADTLLSVLSNVRCSDADVQEGLDELRIELGKQREAGTPWRALNALDPIAMLDMPAWVSVIGLLDECPVIPAALTATLEKRTGAISATEFEFIATRGQLGKVRAFMTRFLDILQR
jgi:hypothetical protein